MRRRISQNANQDGIKTPEGIQDKRIIVNAAIDSYKEDSKDFAISAIKTDPPSMYTALFAKYQKIIQRKLVKADR